MTRDDIVKAKAEIQAAVKSPNMYFELAAKIFGEPKDPTRDVAPVVAAICDVDKTDASEYVYKFDTTLYTKEVYYIDTNSNVTSSKVTPETPSAVTFTDVLTKEYYVAFTDLLQAKYDVIATKTVTIARALDANEVKLTLMLADGTIEAGNRVVLETGETKFRITHLWAMRDKVKDYGTSWVLISGSSVDDDIDRWDFDENKYHSVKDMLNDLNITRIRVVGPVTIGGVAKDILSANKAILVALDTEVSGKPFKFSRKMLNPIEILGGEMDATLERATIVTPAIMPVGANRVPAVAVVGFESIAIVNINKYALAGFTRAKTWAAEA